MTYSGPRAPCERSPQPRRASPRFPPASAGRLLPASTSWPGSRGPPASCRRGRGASSHRRRRRNRRAALSLPGLSRGRSTCVGHRLLGRATPATRRDRSGLSRAPARPADRAPPQRVRRAVGIRRQDFEHGRRRLLQLLGVGHEAASQKQLGGVMEVARHIFVSHLHALLADDLDICEARVHFQVHVADFGRAVEGCGLRRHLLWLCCVPQCAVTVCSVLVVGNTRCSAAPQCAVSLCSVQCLDSAQMDAALYRYGSD
jgi:hypothetical protein